VTLKRILKYLDDLFFLTGIAALTYAGFLLHTILGFAVLGVGLIAMSFLLAGGGNE
jgi:hypothetical protein